MNELIWMTDDEIDLQIANRLRKIRKRKGISQKLLSTMSNVSYGSIKRFERSGNISLSSLTRIAIALDCTNDLLELFKNVPYGSIKEVEEFVFKPRMLKMTIDKDNKINYR